MMTAHRKDFVGFHYGFKSNICVQTQKGDNDMTNFETVGINYQYEATTIEQANKSFKYSCDCCCSKGRHADCDRCAIANVHSLIVAYLNDKTKTERK